MAGRRTIQLARVFGIRIGVGASWFLVLFLYVFVFTPYFHQVIQGSYTTAYLVAVASVLSFFLSLILHELGHAVVARRNGLEVLGIELWALGGITRTSRAPERPGEQFRVAAAGPAVTLVLLIACLALGALLAQDRHFLAVAVARGSVHSTPAAVWLSWTLMLNVLVLVINLIPVFPLDGSQMLQATIWRLTGDRDAAARLAGRFGQGVAVLLGVASLLVIPMAGSQWAFYAVMGVVFAAFLYHGAGAAVLQGAIGQRIKRLTVADIIDREPPVIPGDLRLLDAQERFFGAGRIVPGRGPWMAVVDHARHFLGVVRAEVLEREIAAGRPALAVSEVVEGEHDLPLQIAEDAPLEALLRSDALGRWGCVVAVDREGVLRGVVTLARIRAALRPVSGR
jgi:Zn-dependent protease